MTKKAEGQPQPSDEQAKASEEQAGASAEQEPTTEEGPGTGKGKRNVEEKLDDFADRFSKTLSEGAKRMEDAFEKGMKSLKDNPNIASGRVKGFFTSSQGGAILLVVGLIWFFYAVGLLGQPIFPIIMIVLGIYLMYRYRDKD